MEQNTTTKIVMLGTGSGGVLQLYNTCFVIQKDRKVFLVDTGGSIEIVQRLKQINIPLEAVKDIFVSHAHTDHILGLIWLLKKLGSLVKRGLIKEKINVYGNDTVLEAIKGVSQYILSPSTIETVNQVINYICLSDNENIQINGIEYQFFDIQAKGTKQYGFECLLEGNRFIFLGDETLNPKLYNRVRNADYVAHEAYCLNQEEERFHAYEKNHSTVLSASQVMENLQVKNLILYHTEESHGASRKELFQEEAKTVFSGNVIVPDDLEEIKILKK